jgi:AraC-like DNA-binding protein
MITRACRGKKYAQLRNVNALNQGLISRLLDEKSFQFLRKTMDSMMEDALDPDQLNREAGFGLRSDFRFSHHDPDALNAGLHYLLIFCWRHYLGGSQTTHPTPLHPAIRKAMKLLGKKEAPESLTELADACELSMSYLSRLFLKEMGISISQYRNAARLSHFMELWCGPERITMLDAAYMAGFGSYAQFFKVFRQSYGESPRVCLRSTE